MQPQQTVLVIDYGAQYAQLIARRIREAGVYSEIVSHTVPVADLVARQPAAIVLSGGPRSVYADGAPQVDPALFQAGIAVFGICYGFQAMAHALGGEVARTDLSEFGRTDLRVNQPGQLLAGLPAQLQVWMSHGDAVRAALDASRLPILVGGDHCLAIGSISAVAAWCRAVGKQLRVLWVDAHADFNTAEATPTGNIHGMPVACLTGEGPTQLVNLSDQIPAIEPAQVRQVGLRSVDQQEKQRLVDRGVPVYDMRYIDEVGMRAVIEQALAGAGPDTHVHLSLDLDFVDPAVAPGVGTPVVGGPTYREAQLVMEMVADTGLLGSLDLVEVNPALDLRNATAELAVDLVESLFGKSTLLRMRT